MGAGRFFHQIASPFEPAWRRATAGRRALPDFIIVGAQKAGTSSLHNYLAQHPDVRRPAEKELHYFDQNFHRGEGWYRAHFPLRSAMGPGQITGEATPYYMYHPHAPGRIGRVLPGVKLVALLRDPVERAISSYFHAVRFGRERLPIGEAMAAEEGRVEAAYRRMEEDPRADSMEVQYLSYKKRGHYLEQLRRCEAAVGRERLLVMEAEALFADPAPVLGRTFAFLGVDPGFLPGDLRPRNRGEYRSEVPGEVRAALREEFREPNRRLAEYLGWKPSWA